MQDLIKIETTPPSIVANFDEIEAQLQEYLRQYDVVVSADGVGDAKKLRTELRKQITELDTRIKEALKDASAPIREADERRKQLVKLGRDVDAKIKEQVDRFEDETRVRAHAVLEQTRADLWDEYSITAEFRRAEFEDLVKVTALTKKGSLAKATGDELEKRVRDDKALQDQTEKRLAGLAGASYDAGLAAPLTRDHVEHFLFAGDDKYAAELQRILDAEVERQHRAEQRVRDNAEREAHQKAEAEAKEAERQRRMEDAARAESGAPEAPQGAEETPPWEDEPPAVGADGAPDAPAVPPPGTEPVAGRDTWYVVLTFEVRVPAGTSRDDIKAQARSIVDERALKTLKNITAQKRQGVAA